MPARLKTAVVQTAPALAQCRENREKMTAAVREAAENGARLVVFPECSLTGYVFSSRREALPSAETVPGPSTDSLAALCGELQIYIVFGLLEKRQEKLFNAAVLLGPGGLIGKYAKNHLPFLGVDRFTDKGEQPFQVYPTPIGNIGLHICYDVIFPESSRVMALQGAEILVLISNFPEGRGEKVITHVITARALENRVNMVAANRVGTERGCRFAGLSKMVDAAGNTLAQASPEDEQIIYGEIDVESARRKRLVIVPGQYEVDHFGHRRPELYGVITQPGRQEA